MPGGGAVAGVGTASRGVGATGCDAAGPAGGTDCGVALTADSVDAGAGLAGFGALIFASCFFRISILISVCFIRFAKSLRSPGLNEAEP